MELTPGAGIPIPGTTSSQGAGENPPSCKLQELLDAPEFCNLCNEVMSYLNGSDEPQCINCGPGTPSSQQQQHPSGALDHQPLEGDRAVVKVEDLPAHVGVGCGNAECTATCPDLMTHAADGGPPVVVQHQHETYIEDGVEYKKCTQVRKVSSKKVGNRLAVQRYRQKKKNEFEKLKRDNAELRQRVAELEEIVSLQEGGSLPDQKRVGHAAELKHLREVVRQISGLVGTVATAAAKGKAEE